MESLKRVIAKETSTGNRITKGKVYTVHEDMGDLYFVTADDGHSSGVFKHRFDDYKESQRGEFYVAEIKMAGNGTIETFQRSNGLYKSAFGEYDAAEAHAIQLSKQHTDRSYVVMSIAARITSEPMFNTVVKRA